jgi:formamidopyrimidine-DNA glycosylase
MPELPEVETVRRGLEPCLAGAVLTRVEARRPDLRFPFPKNFAARLTGRRIEGLKRRGKYLLFDLDDAETLLVHLGMTGRFMVENGQSVRRPGAHARAAPADERHAHVILQTASGARITFYDARRFGFMDLVPTAELMAHPRLAGMGPEPLSARFEAAWLVETFAHRRQAVKSLLLDQRIVAGLGNIYACEALHRARISPLSPAQGLSLAKLRRLVGAVREVLEAAILAGGSSLRDFADAAGDMGYFQHSFRVYGRAGEACPRQGCAGRIARVVQSGRSTFYCPTCQR